MILKISLIMLAVIILNVIVCIISDAGSVKDKTDEQLEDEITKIDMLFWRLLGFTVRNKYDIVWRKKMIERGYYNED